MSDPAEKTESEYIYRQKVDRLLDGLDKKLSHEFENASVRRHDAVNTMSESVGRVARRVEQVKEEVEQLKQESAEYRLKISALGKEAQRTNKDVSVLKDDYKDGAKRIESTLLRFGETFADLAKTIGIMSADMGNMKTLREKDSENISELFRKHDSDVEEDKEELKGQLKRRNAWAMCIVGVVSPLIVTGILYLFKGTVG